MRIKLIEPELYMYLEMTFNMGDSQPLHLHHIQNVFRTSLCKINLQNC